MSYTTARAQLVTLLEAVSLSGGGTPLGMRPTLKHQPEGHDELLPEPRGFYLRGGAGAAGILGPYVPDITGSPLQQTPVDLVVIYPGPETQNRQALDEVIEEDRGAIAKALMTPSNWSSGTSTIAWLEESPLYAPAEREEVEGATLLIFRFLLVHR